MSRAFVTRNAARLLLAATVVIAMTGLAYAWFSTQSTGSAAAATASLAAPTNVAGSVAGSTVTVTWTGVTGPDAGPVTGYYVVRYAGATPSAACGSSAASLLAATPTSCADNVADGTYTYRVVAVFHSWTATSAPSGAVTVSGDTAAPTVLSIDRAAASPTNANDVAWLVTFSESVTGVDATDFALAGSGLTGTSVGSVAGSGATRTVHASTGSGNGTLGLNLVDDDSIVDANANPLGGGRTGQVYTVDRSAPAVTVEQAAGQADPTSAATVHFTAVFSEPVTGLIGSDVALTGAGSAGAFATVTESGGSGTTYDIEVTVTAANGAVVAALPAAAATDAAGNASAASTGTDGSVTRDTAAPAATVTQAATQADPAKTSPIRFAVTFSEPVTGFAAADVALSGTAGPTTAAVTGSGAVYEVAVSGMTGQGSVIAAVAAGAAADAAGNPSTAATAGDNIVDYDTVAPTVTSVLRADPSPTGAGSLSWTVTFSEAVSGVTTANFSLVTANTSGTAPALTTATGTGGSTASSWTVTATTAGTVGANNGSIRLDLTSVTGIADAAANTVATTPPVTGQAYAFDTTPPTVALVRTGGAQTNAASVSWTVTFSEPVTGVDTGDFALAASGLTGTSITGLTAVSSTVYTVTASTGSGTGSLGLNFADNDSVVDGLGRPAGGTGAGNGNVTGEAYSVDRVAPTGLTAVCVFGTGSNYSCTGTAGTAAGDSTTVTLTVLKGTEVVAGPTAITRTGATWEWASSNLAKGTYTATLTQTDAAGNSTTVTSPGFTRN